VPDPLEILATIGECRDEIRKSMESHPYAEFEKRRRELGREAPAAKTVEQQRALEGALLTLIQDYPPVGEILQRRAPGIFGPDPLPETPTPVSTGSGSAAGNEHPEDQAPSPVADASQAVGAPTTAAPVGAEGGQQNAQPPSTTPHTQATTWTPDVIMSAFKEAVTATIGLVLIAFTVYLAIRTIGFAGKPKKVADSKDVLQLMLGLAGVVLGYYFGRVPADARATQATQQAVAASERAARVAAKGDELASKVEGTLGGAAITRGGGVSDEDLADIRQAHAELRALASA
jgi:hypothetical protein